MKSSTSSFSKIETLAWFYIGMKDTSFVCLFFLLFSLAALNGCKAPEDGVEADPSAPSNGGTPWRPGPGDGFDGGSAQSPALNFLTYQIPLAHPRGSLGGLDITYINGKLHAAFAMKVLDVEGGTTFYRLFYANNTSGSWRIWYLKSSTTRFYYLRSGNYSSNNVRIHRNMYGEPVILYIDRNNRLVQLRKSNDSWTESVLVTEQVGSFASALDLSNNTLHVATTAIYYNTREVRYYAFKDESLVDSFVYSGNISPGTNNNHLTINLYRNRPIILVKHYDPSINGGRFLMIKDRQGYVIANGVNSSGVFSSYWDGHELKSCYRNVINDRFEVSINVETLSLRTRKTYYNHEYAYPLHCFVSRFSQLPFARYNINQTYSTNFEIYSWDGLGERTQSSWPFQGIRFLDTRSGFVFAGGLDRESGRPQFLQLR
jgi:hypothetical protein